MFDRWSDQTTQVLLEAWNSRSLQSTQEGLHLAWEQLIEAWLQTKCTFQRYDLNFFVDALQSKIIYLTGNSRKFNIITFSTVVPLKKFINIDLTNCFITLKSI